MSEPEVNGGPSPLAMSGVATFLLVASGALWLDANGLPVAGGMGVGPSAALRLVAGLLLILALAHYLAAWRARRAPGARNGAVRADKPALAWAMGGLVATVALIALNGGFILAATTLFVATARAFGKPVGLTSIGIGLILAIVASLFFTLVLTLALPPGLVEGILYPGA